MVESWGDPFSSKCVLVVFMLDREFDPLVTIARKCGSLEVISTINGNLRVDIPNLCLSEATTTGDDATIGFHLFQKHRSDSSSRLASSCIAILVCTLKSIRQAFSFQTFHLFAEWHMYSSLKSLEMAPDNIVYDDNQRAEKFDTLYIRNLVSFNYLGLCKHTLNIDLFGFVI